MSLGDKLRLRSPNRAGSSVVELLLSKQKPALNVAGGSGERPAVWARPSGRTSSLTLACASEIFLTHAAHHKRQVVALRERRQDRMVECGVVLAFEYPDTAGLAHTGLDACQKVVLTEVAGAR